MSAPCVPDAETKRLRNAVIEARMVHERTKGPAREHAFQVLQTAMNNFMEMRARKIKEYGLDIL